MIFTKPNMQKNLVDVSKKYKFLTLPECRRAIQKKKIILTLPLIKKIDKKQDKVVGYLNGYVTTMYAEKPMSNYYKVTHNKNYYYCECNKEKNKFSCVIGYLEVGDNEYVEVQQKPSFILLLLIALIIGCFLYFCLGKIDFDNLRNRLQNQEEIIINDNVVDLDNIPEDTTEIDVTQDLAYISGQSITTIKDSYQNVYLMNDKLNTKYTLIYEVYVEGKEDYVYKTGHIPSGSAEPWNAFNCEDIKIGKNNVNYEVYVYDLSGNLVAETSLTGLTIIKE